MIVSATMDLGQLAECMGAVYGEDEAREMRDLLVAEHDGEDTHEIPDDVWVNLVEAADVAAIYARGEQ